jgi:hypothetical protein
LGLVSSHVTSPAERHAGVLAVTAEPDAGEPDAGETAIPRAATEPSAAATPSARAPLGRFGNGEGRRMEGSSLG